MHNTYLVAPAAPANTIANSGYDDLTGDLRVLIRRHTAAEFVVEQRSVARRHSQVTRTLLHTPRILRFEFQLKPRTATAYPEISVRITRNLLDPAYRRSREDDELDEAEVREFEEFEVGFATTETFSSINKVCVVVDKENSNFGHFAFFQNTPCHDSSNPHALRERPVRVTWNKRPRVTRQTWKEVRQKLESVFRMELHAE